MKLVVVNYYQTNVHRGLETYVRELTSRLHHNLQTDVWSSNSARLPTSLFPRILHRLFLTPTDFSILVFYLYQIPKLLQVRPNFIIVTNCGWHLFFYRFLTFVLDTKLILIGQSGPGWDDRFNLLLAPDVFICLSPHQQLWAKSVFHWPGTLLPIIPNGVDVKKFYRASPIMTKQSHPRVLCVAATIPSKNIFAVIHGVASHPHASLTLLGDGPLSGSIDVEGKSKLKSRYLRLTVPHEDIVSYYTASDIFILISDSSEAFGIAYLEALAAGLPIVATDDELRRFIVGNCGVFISSWSTPGEIAVALDRALKLPQGRHWQRDLKKQLQNFSWDTISDKYLQLFHQLKRS